MIQTYTGKESATFVETAFRSGQALLIPWSSPAKERIVEAMGEVAGYLAGFPPTPSFGGIDNLDADRQTLWVASTGLGEPFHLQQEALARFDGDAEGGERGLEALARDETVRKALEDLKGALDHALEMAVKAIGLAHDHPPELMEKLTIRYRAIRYAPVDREVAGIGLHPDGNVLSALITDGPGLLVKAPGGEARPPTDGTVLMPGSILYRWSQGDFKPTFHRVEIRRGDRTKFTMVGFLNFPDRMHVARTTLRNQSGSFFNDVHRHKEDDMDRAGDLAPLWSELERWS